MTHFLLPSLMAKRNAVRLGSLLLKCALFLPLPVFCQSRAVSVARIPFGFSANGKTLPPGEYLLYRDSDFIYSLKAQSGVLACRLMVYRDSAAKAADASKFVFRNSADGYALESFWAEGSSEGMRLVNRGHKREEIGKADTSGTVMIAASTTAQLTR